MQEPQEFTDQNVLDNEIAEETQSPRKRQIITAVICVLIVMLLAVTSALLVKTYVIATFTVDGISMYPTLDGGGGASMDNN